MSRPARCVAAALAVPAAALIAGCASAAPSASGAAAGLPTAGKPSLATSMVTATGTWALAVIGGPAASHNNFWQLFVRPAGRSRWKLVTPPGTADNGGLVLAADGRSLITGFRPSQYLTYTPLTATADGGQAWTSTGPLDAALANVPDALAVEPGTARLLALLAGGTAELAAPGYTSWTTLVSQRSLAATSAGRACGLDAVTAVAYAPSGAPLIAGSCSRPGTVGIFADTGGHWLAAGPRLPAVLASQSVTVLRLTQAASQTVALLRAGSGHNAGALAAWSADDGRNWTLSPVLQLGGAAVASASFGTGGTAAVLMTTGRAEMITGGSSWRTLPAPPPGTVTLALGPGGQADALSVRAATLTIWQLPQGASDWTKLQVITVPIQYGSSG